MTEHTLVRDGWPHWLTPWDEAKPNTLSPTGRALCSCTWLSDPLPTTQARRAAWAKHAEEER